jgi:hypothetical protein
MARPTLRLHWGKINRRYSWQLLVSGGVATETIDLMVIETSSLRGGTFF